jgi:hypothetical protein
MRLVLALAAASLWGAPASAPVFASPAPAAAAPAQPTCGDFLARMKKKPAHLTYVSCKAFPDDQGKPLRATYRVSGRSAAATEAYFVHAFGMRRLKRSCCQWDGPARQFRDARGREYSIRMASDETPRASRSAWRRIASFEITVETFTEEI